MLDLGSRIESMYGLNDLHRSMTGEHSLFRIVLDMMALQLDELLESESAERHTTTGVLPASPSQVLLSRVSETTADEDSIVMHSQD